MNGLIQDLRYGLRQLRKNPVFFAIAALTLAIAIGANTAIFSVVNGLLLRKPHLPDPDRLLVISSVNLADRGTERSAVSAPDFLDWHSQATSFSGMAAATFDDFTISNDQSPERVAGSRVSADFFRVMGVAPALGRPILPEESQPVVVLSDALWRSRFGAASNVLGSTLKVDGVAHSIVGVMPRTFHNWEFQSDLWTPLQFSPPELAPAARTSRSFMVFARLKPEIRVKQAAEQMSAIARRLAAAHPDTNKDWGTSVMSLQHYSIADANTATALLFLMGTVGFVLLIACANVACLLLARSASRMQEFVTRTVLGAGRLRLARQLLAECLCLSLTAAGLGALFGIGAVEIIRRQFDWNPYAVAMAKEISIDPRVLLFTLIIATVAALVFGLVPGLQIAHHNPAGGLRESSRWATSGRKQHRVQKVLVVGQLALSLILLVGAGLFVEGFIEEMRAKPGFSTDRVLTASLSLRGSAYNTSPQRQTTFFSNVLNELRSNPQVESATLTSALPYSFPPGQDFAVEAPTGKSEQKGSCGHFVVGPGYFSALQIPIAEGREFSSMDNASGSPVVVVNRAFVRRYFGSEDPIGRHVRFDRGKDGTSQWSEIVGVIGDVNELLGQGRPRPHIYEPFLVHPSSSMNLVVRTRSGAVRVADSLRRAVWAVDRDQAITEVRTMRRVIADSGSGDGLMSGLMSTFAMIALTMAAIGIYGVLSYSVSLRTKEMGIRMAVGAEASQVQRLVMRGGTALSGMGILLGVLASLALPKLMASVFGSFGFHSMLVVATAPIAVLVIALAACYFPARRAAKVDPMVALRYE